MIESKDVIDVLAEFQKREGIIARDNLPSVMSKDMRGYLERSGLIEGIDPVIPGLDTCLFWQITEKGKRAIASYNKDQNKIRALFNNERNTRITILISFFNLLVTLYVAICK